MSKPKEQEREEIVAKVKKRYGQAARSNQAVIGAWEEARLFYRGDQWLKPSGTKWVSDTAPKWRVRLTINKMIPAAESVISTFLKARPIVTATAATDEDDDIKSAKVSENLLRYFYEELNHDELNFDALLWMCVTGSAYGVVDWDPTKGRKVPVMPDIPDGPLPLGEDGEEMPLMAEPELQPIGMPHVEILGPFCVAIEPGAEKLEDAAWIIVTKIMLRTEVEERWGVELKDSSSTGSSSLHIPLYIDRDSRIVEKERVAVHKMYQRPSKKHPNGKIYYCTPDTYLGEEDLPFGEIQMVHFRGIPLPGELHPTSLVSQGIPLQLEMNRGRSQLVENRNLCARPQIVAAFGAIEEQSWDNRPGSILPWDPIAARGIEPHYMSPPQVPQWVLHILNLSEQDLMDLTSRHEVSQGSSTSNVTSGRQAAIYKGADDARLTPAIRRFEKSLAKMGKWILRETKAHWQGEQIIRIIGKNREAEYLRFAANDISDTCNVTYEIASQLPWAKESMRQQIMFLNQQGKIDDATMFEMLEMPTVSRLYESEQAHKLNARYENQKLKQGYFPCIATDNHAVHIREHEAEVNRPEFREQFIMEMQQQAMMQGDEAQIPGSVQAIMQHLEAHRKLLPATPPPPPMTRVQLNIERLITDLAAVNPQLAQQLIPYAIDLMGDASGYRGAPAGAEQPQDGGMGSLPGEMPPPSAGALGTPMDGMDGQMYSPEAQPAEGEMYGGPDLGSAQ